MGRMGCSGASFLLTVAITTLGWSQTIDRKGKAPEGEARTPGSTASTIEEQPGSTIPSRVTDEEYAIYAAWIDHHFKQQPEHLFIQSRTFTFDPAGAGPCNLLPLERQGRIDPALLESLHQLGKALYPVHTVKFRSQPFKIPWEFQESEGRAIQPFRPFKLVAFSRVAFNHDRTQALLAVDILCGEICGGGNPVVATRDNGAWTFNENIGCLWKY